MVAYGVQPRAERPRAAMLELPERRHRARQRLLERILHIEALAQVSADPAPEPLPELDLLLAEERLQRLSEMVGQTLMVQVIEINRRKRRLILSATKAQREWRTMQRRIVELFAALDWDSRYDYKTERTR